MAYTKDITRFSHGTYGTGIFRGYGNSGILLIDFAGNGVKKFAESSIKLGHLTQISDVPQPKQQPAPKPVPQPPVIAPVIHSGSSTRQYDTSDTIIGDKNILEAFDCEDIVLFNESYVVIGEETHARIIRAAYDLTIIGHLSASEIQVNGTLTVTGSLVAQKVNCSNNLLCRGNVTVDDIYVGGDMIADSVKCSDFLCDGNAVIRTTIDINKFINTEKTMVACEGIIGGGTFAAMNAIANEYFEFDGDIEGHIVELETETTLSEVSVPASAPAVVAADISNMPIEEVLAKIAERIRAEYARMGELDEDALLELTQILSSGSLGELEDMGKLFEQLIQISYKDEIDDLGDYLVIEYAKKKLPSQLYRYETVEHVDSILLPKVVACLDELKFIPASIEKIAQALHIIMQMQGHLPLSTEALCDKVFSSIGLRFVTVKGIMNRTGTARPATSTVPTAEPVMEAVSKTVVQTDTSMSEGAEDYKPTPVVIACANRADFLSKPLSAIGKSFTMTNDEIVRLGSVRIRTVGEFIVVDEAFIRELYKKKPFLANHLITVLKRMKAAKSQIK